MKIGIIAAATFGLLVIAAPAQANGTAPGLCGVSSAKAGLALVACGTPAARPAGKLTLRLDAPVDRARRAPDPLSTSELGRRQLDQLIASL